MTFTPEQLRDYRDFFSILDGIARRLHREGKMRMENGKMIFVEEEKSPRRRTSKRKVAMTRQGRGMIN